MERIFGSQGVLAHHLPGYEPRPGQQEMAGAVSGLLHEIGPVDDEGPLQADCLVVEAETGLGKTLAYLVPAVLSGRRVVVSTNTRNLQDQILEREIPFIRQYIDPELKALCVKGRQNYLCLYRWHQFAALPQGELFDDSLKKQIEDWIERTRFADRAELGRLASSSPLWQKICCLSHFCPGSDCPDNSRCFLNRLRREAAAADLLVVNHHLLFSDLAVRKGGYGEVLPRYEAVIFDEAHHLESVATRFFGRSFSRYQVLDLCGDIERSALSDLAKTIREPLLKAVQAVVGCMEQLSGVFPQERGRFPLQEFLAADRGLAEKRDALLTAFDRLLEQLDLPGTPQEPWEQYGLRCAELAEQLAFITAESFDDTGEEARFIHWFERTEKNLLLSATPVDVAEELKESLFAVVSGCVFTSATLTVGGDFGYFFKRLGLSPETPGLRFPSPFDYPGRTLLYIPEAGFPEPAAPGYASALHDRIRQLVESSGGRALLLFTSFKALELAWQELEDKLDFPLLRQGEVPRRELLRRFADETTSILFAVASFWEGVDIPGESLSLVVIDKLPFEVPTDPVIMARMNRIRAGGGNPFFEFQVPRAILTLRQGVGRLMRSSTDRGVMAILDIRLFSKGYGKRFRKSLPPSPLVRDLEAVDEFFRQENE